LARVLVFVMDMSVSENDLAFAAAQGDGRAFAALLEGCYERLFGLCFRLMGSQAEAEDLCQDICAALPAKLGGYKGSAQFRTWLYRVAVNAAHDRRRKAARLAKTAQGWGDWEINRQAELAETAAARDWLSSAMTSLPADIRDTLALVLDEVSHAEAAEILGVSEGTVSWRVSKAKDKLRQMRAQEDEL